MSNDLKWLHKLVINILKNMRSLDAESMIYFKFEKLLFFRKVTQFQRVTFTQNNATHPEMHINKVWCKIILSAWKDRTFLKIFMTNLCSHSKSLLIKD